MYSLDAKNVSIFHAPRVGDFIVFRNRQTREVYQDMKAWCLLQHGDEPNWRRPIIPEIGKHESMAEFCAAIVRYDQNIETDGATK
jgi:hypothetical protein